MHYGGGEKRKINKETMVPNSGVEEKLFQDKVLNELGVPK